jgi:hypothetical protein
MGAEDKVDGKIFSCHCGPQICEYVRSSKEDIYNIVTAAKARIPKEIIDYASGNISGRLW